MGADHCLWGNVHENCLLCFHEGFSKDKILCTDVMIPLRSGVQCLFISYINDVKTLASRIHSMGIFH